MDPQTQDQPVAPETPTNNSAEARAQIANAIKGGKNILVTVGENPSVDELASALGFTFLLGKLDKHATAVFSGEIPPAMEFLDPESTFERTVDSLRDFIIALDKEKADKLRYKVEDDVVKVFITPYKTVISEKDLKFSQGDFNVDVVVALGVEKREELDKAITAHGRILHDATVIVVNAGFQKSSLGAIDWNEDLASSVAEMLVGLSTELGNNLLDEQISTAFLTGIVAETNRFSNEKTSPKVMTLAAQLMAAGANQQLIATNLRHEGMISEPVRKKEDDQPHDDNGEMVLNHKADSEKNSTSDSKNENTDSDADNSSDTESTKPSTPKKPTISKKDSKPSEDSKSVESKVKEGKELSVDTDPKQTLEAALDTSLEPQNNEEKDSAEKDSSEEISSVSDDKIDSPTEPEQGKTNVAPVIEPLPMPTPQSGGTSGSDQEASDSTNQPPEPSISSLDSAPPEIKSIQAPAPMDQPTFGGTLNATTASAEEARNEQIEREKAVNNVALQHEEAPQTQDAVEEARKAVENAAVSQPFNPANQPLQAINSNPLPETEPAVDSTVSEMQSDASAPADVKPEPSPMEAFMQPQTNPNALNNGFNVGPPPVRQPMPDSTTLPSTPEVPNLPPLPPMPTTNGGVMPPMPPLPGQPVDPSAAIAPQVNPEFMQNMPQSQNPWTEAGREVTALQDHAESDRQAKMKKMTQQYDTAVDRNRELQGLPPLNDPNGSGFPPPPVR